LVQKHDRTSERPWRKNSCALEEKCPQKKAEPNFESSLARSRHPKEKKHQQLGKKSRRAVTFKFDNTYSTVATKDALKISQKRRLFKLKKEWSGGILSFLDVREGGLLAEDQERGGRLGRGGVS